MPQTASTARILPTDSAEEALINGHEIGEVFYGHREEFALAPGAYSVQVVMDWCQSEPYDVEIGPGEMVELVGGLRWRGWAWPKNLLHLIFRPKSAYVVRARQKHEPNWAWIEQLFFTADIVAVALVILFIVFMMLRS